MKKTLKIAALVGFTGMLAVMPLMAAAQQIPPVELGGRDAFQYIVDLINKLTTWMLTALIIVAAVMIVYAGFIYLTAGSNPENVDKAKNIIIYAAVAIGVGLLAKVVTLLAQQFVRGG